MGEGGEGVGGQRLRMNHKKPRTIASQISGANYTIDTKYICFVSWECKYIDLRIVLRRVPNPTISTTWGGGVKLLEKRVRVGVKRV